MAPGHDVNDSVGHITGLHLVRIPVTSALASRDWYSEVLGFVPVLDLEEEGGVVGSVLRHPQGFAIGLHTDAVRARALRGFAVLGLSVSDRGELTSWADDLERRGIPHLPEERGHLGWYMDVPDVEGIVVRFHTGVAPYAEEA